MNQKETDPERHQHRHSLSGCRDQTKRDPRVDESHKRGRYSHERVPGQHRSPDAPRIPRHPFPARPKRTADRTSLEQQDRHDEEAANVSNRDAPEQSGCQHDADRHGDEERRRLLGKVVIDVMSREQKTVRERGQAQERRKQPRKPHELHDPDAK